MRAVVPALLLSVLAAPSFASDGVLEINQTCAVQTGCVVGDAAGFPVLIRASGSYRLTSNLVVPDENTDGIQVAESSVSIDLGGFEIRGPVVCSKPFAMPLSCLPSAGTGSGITTDSSSNTRISVRNGNVVGMGANGITVGAQAEVVGVRASSNRLIGISAIGTSATFRGNSASLNGGAGISMVGGTFVGNSSESNGGQGIVATGIAGALVSGNSVAGNSGDGINVSDGATVSNNSVFFNTGDGIETGFGCTVIGNTLGRNVGFGLNLGPWSGYRENVISYTTALGTVNGTDLVDLGNNACLGSTDCP